MALSSMLGLKYDIAASLYWQSATIEELMKRDFLHQRSEYGVSVLLDSLERSDMVRRDKHDVYHVYKKVVREKLNPHGYELY